MTRPPIADRASALDPADTRGTALASLFGLALGVGLLKFGNPVILDHLVETPRSLEEWRVFAWPLRIGFLLLIPVVLAGAAFVATHPDRRPRAPAWILGCLGAWFAWQVVATVAAVDPPSARALLAHFAACAVGFVLGHWGLARVAVPRVFWMCLVLAFLTVLAFAFQQRFGGLEATRKMILDRPDAATLPPEYLARIRSNRVFSTLVYPNALAAAILLLLPLSTVCAAAWGRRWGRPGSWVAGLATFAAGAAVLVWSGSKAGWLVAMGLVLVVLLHAPMPTRWKTGLALGFIAAGLIAFAWVFREKLARGPTSVAARADYWTAAVQAFRERPVTGQGPGGFKRVYARVKRPESEMAQLAHNDYLQQAADSGLPGFLAYGAFVVGALGHLYRRLRRTPPQERHPLAVAVFLGLLGWFAHGFVEFGLYIPATAWCAFTLLGWALASVPALHDSKATASPG